MSGGIVSYNDYINEDKTKIYTGNVLKKYNEEQAKQNYEKTKYIAKNAQKEIKQAIKTEQKNLGLQTPVLSPLANKSTGYRDDNGILRLKSAYETNKENIDKYTKQLAYNQRVTDSSPVINQLRQLSQDVNNQKLLAKYNYDVAKEDNHDINLWDRTGGVVTRAIGDFFNPEKLNSSGYYYGDNGKMTLPTASQIRQENVSNSYGDDLFGKIGKFATDVGYNLTKIGLSSAINTVVPGAGSAMYFTDMASDSFNNAKLNGYDDKSAALSSVVGVATEMVTEKLLGGFSKLMGGESAVSSTINKTLSKVMKNDRLRSILANAASEGMEEFVQEFIEKLNHNLILDKNSLGKSFENTFTKETLEDALYSTLVGMGSGGLMGGVNVEINTNNTGVIPNIENGQIDTSNYVNQLENVKQNTTDNQKINNINEVLNSIDNVNQISSDPFMAMRERVENDNNTNTKSFSQQVDEVVNGTYPKRDMLTVSQHTPQVLQDIGLKDLPITLTQKHLETIANKKGNDLKANYHDLGIDVVKQIPEALNRPLNVLKSDTKSDSIVVVTELSDKNNNIVIASIKIDGKGNINDINIDTNVMTSAYGKDNYDTFMKNNINKGNLLYDIDEGIIKKLDTTDRVQFPMRSPTSYMDNNTTNSSKSQLLSNDNYMQLKGNDVLRAKNSNVKNNQNSNLSQTEIAELNALNDVKNGGFASDTELQRIEYLENKQNGLIKYPELKNKIEFKDISKEYTKYKNGTDNFNAKLLNDAKESVKGYRNTRTKAQWLEVAENIGLNFKGNSQELTDYAVQSWFEAQPNTKNSLNREGKGYVKFTIDEWVNSVYKGAGVGNVIAKKTTNSTNTENKVNNTKKVDTKEELDNSMSYKDNENRTIVLPNDVGLRIVDKTNVDVTELGHLQSIISNSEDTKVNGDNIEFNGGYDNSMFTVTAHKQGDVYVVDNVTKKVQNSLGSVVKIKSDTLNENIKSDVIKQDSNIKDNYQNTVKKAKNTEESKFYKNITETSKFISEDNRENLSKIGDIKYYETISNEKSLNEASKRLAKDGSTEAVRWLNQNKKISDSVDVAEGWILLKNYQDSGDFDSMVAVAKKMREMGTTAGQAVQAYNIMQRLTPEGMVKYAQSELSDAYEVYAKNKSQSWIDKNASSFDLNTEEVSFIVDTMQEVQKMEDGRAKKVKLGEIQSMLENKLPAEKGAGIKSWMRISMLFNPKTQIRNVMGNAVIAPVNMVGDFFASKVDKIISKKTGVRTTGTTDIKSVGKGFKKGLFESYDDFKRGINTRDIKDNRFELGQGKSFNDNTKLGKALNRVDALNSFLLDAGDRGFYEAAFTNSINNQLVLNNTTKVTQNMIDIATSEALQRTWQDNNNYTKFVLQTRNALNKINVKGYGLGDVLIPFAKTPANLTKAIVDYSPAGLVKALVEGRNLKNNISTGKNTAVEQHRFVQDLGKATAGTMLYIAAYGLAKAGVITGESDDDKDTRNFIKNTLGVSSYSIKIGDKSFTYDWAQPIAAPLSIMSNIVNSKNSKGQALLEAVTSSLDSAGSILLEQSFLKSINEVLTDNDGIVSGLENAILDLPTRAIPTFMKQITDITDSTQRQTFEYDKPLKTAVNKIKAKIPGLSQTLDASVDTMGREIQKYGGKNNIFNVFLNPANVNTSNISDGAKEIYRVYKEIGDKTIMPRVAPYYINSKGQKTILNTEQRKDYQKVSGKIIEDSMNELLKNKNYKSMSDEEKSSIINNIVNYSYNKAKKEILGLEISGYNSLEKWLESGKSVASYYANKEEADFSISSPVKYSTLQSMNVDYYDYKDYQAKVNEIKTKYSGTNNSSIRKQKVFEYLNSLNMNKNKKIILFKLLGNYSIKNYSSSIRSYINNFDLSAKEKQEIWNTLF